MPAVGVDRAEHHVIVEHHSPVELPEIERDLAMTADAEQAHHSARRRAAENPGDERGSPGAFDDHIGGKLVDVVHRASEIKRAEVADELRLRPILVMIEYIDLVVALL